jgi:hypothetical protein
MISHLPPSDKDKGERCPTNELIRQIDGASFYELVTDQQNALELLFDVLPDAIYEASNRTYKIADKEKLKTFYNLAYGSQE